MLLFLFIYIFLQSSCFLVVIFLGVVCFFVFVCKFVRTFVCLDYCIKYEQTGHDMSFNLSGMW